MGLANSGSISFGDLSQEFGGSTNVKLSDYYRISGLVDARPDNMDIPLDGEISVSNFYGSTDSETISYTKDTYSLGTSSQSSTETFTASEINGGTISWSQDWQVGDTFVVIGSDVNDFFGFRSGKVSSVNASNQPSALSLENAGGYNTESSTRSILNQRTGSTSSTITGTTYFSKTAQPTFLEKDSFNITGTLAAYWQGSFIRGDILRIESSDVDPFHEERIAIVNDLDFKGVPSVITAINNGGYRKNLSIREVRNERTNVVSVLSGVSYSSIDGSEVSSNFVTEQQKIANILMVGQSNIAYHGTEFFGFAAKNDTNDFVNTANGDGDLVRALSPIGNNHLPSSGDTRTDVTGGNMDGVIGNNIIDSTTYTGVNVYNVAVDGTRIGEWREDASSSAYGGSQYDDFNYSNNKLFERVEFAKQQADFDNNPFTHVFMHIGESDGIEGTTKAQYKTDMLAFIQDLRNLGITAHIMLGKTTYFNGSTDAEIRQAIDELVSENNDIYAGPDTDQLGSSFRYDNVHFNENGLLQVGSDWAQTFSAVTP